MFQKVRKYAETHNTILILIFIVLLGAFLRIKGLTYQSYWLDELYSASYSDPANSFGRMFSYVSEDNHPPLYQTFLWISYHLFGYSELVGRAFSAVMGILGVVAIYFLGKELFNKEIGLYASFFAAINYFLIYYSQETRAYSMLLLFTIISYTYFVKVLKEPSNKSILLYWLSTIILFNTHYFGFFLVATQVFVFLWSIISFPEKRKSLIKLAVYTSIVFILSLLPNMQSLIANSGVDVWWIKEPTPTFFIKYIFSYFHTKWLVILFAIGALISLWYLSKRSTPEREKTALILLLIWIVIAYLLPYLMSILYAPLLTDRNTIIILPAILMIASYGIWRISSWKKIVLLVTISLLSIYALRVYYILPVKTQYREVLRAIIQYQIIPTYSAVPYGSREGINHYQRYADMLHLDININTQKTLKSDQQNRKLPNCFWVLDAQGDHVTDLKLDNNILYQRLYEINLYDANAVLYSLKSYADSCKKKMEVDLH